MNIDEQELRDAVLFLEQQIHTQFLSRTSKMEFLEQKRIIESMLAEKYKHDDLS
ncbi:hypothetical protein [Terribacillus saccharophilus]|uniref:hypothetical protein n=1 Tax=Terribacillus saccharophilus TaxID=361277 RepID=UPI001481FA74|nr:hypothetical protein [Terribacillus saccharophilus]